MAFALTKADSARRDGYVKELNEKAATLDDAVRVYNEGVTALRDTLEKAVADYNETLGDARGFAEDIASAAEAAIDAKSDKWQEGGKGQAAGVWRDEWQAVELDDIEIEWPADLEIESPSHADNLEALSFEAQDD